MCADRVVCVFQHQVCEQRIFSDRICIYERDGLIIVQRKVSPIFVSIKTKKFRDIMEHMDPFCKEQRNDDKKIEILFFISSMPSMTVGELFSIKQDLIIYSSVFSSINSAVEVKSSLL